MEDLLEAPVLRTGFLLAEVEFIWWTKSKTRRSLQICSKIVLTFEKGFS